MNKTLFLGSLLMLMSACASNTATNLVNPIDMYPAYNENRKFVEAEPTDFRRSDLDEFFAAERTSKESALHQSYISQGIALSDLLCNEWFGRLEAAQSDIDYRQGSTAIAGTAGLTLMGALSAKAKEVASVGALFSAGNSYFELQKAVFLFTPDIHIVRKKIAELRVVVAEKLRNDGVNLGNHADVKARLIAYHQLCSGAQIKSYIDQAVVKTRYSFDLPGELSKSQKSRVDVLSSQLNANLSNNSRSSSIQVDTLKKLFAAVYATDVYADWPADPFAASLKAELDNLSGTPASYTQALDLLQQIGVLADFDEAITKAHQAIAEKAAINAKDIDQDEKDKQIARINNVIRNSMNFTGSKPFVISVEPAINGDAVSIKQAD